MTVPPSRRNAGFSFASASIEVSGAHDLVARQLRLRDRHDPVVVEAAVPRGGRARWLRTANASCASREIAVSVRQPLGRLAERDRPALRHARVHEPPAERRRGQRLVAARESRAPASAAPTARGVIDSTPPVSTSDASPHSIARLPAIAASSDERTGG